MIFGQQVQPYVPMHVGFTGTEKKWDRVTIRSSGYVDLWSKLQALYVSKRGAFDGRPRGTTVPRLTWLDMLTLAEKWDDAYRSTPQGAAAYRSPSVLIPTDRTEYDLWTTTVRRLRQAANVVRQEHPDTWGAIQPDLAAILDFWVATRRLSIYLDSLMARPSAWELLIEVIDETFREPRDRLEELLRLALVGGAVLGGIWITSKVVSWFRRD